MSIPFLVVTGDLHAEYHRDVLHALGDEVPCQHLLQLLGQKFALPHQQMIIDIDGEDDRVFVLAR